MNHYNRLTTCEISPDPVIREDEFTYRRNVVNTWCQENDTNPAMDEHIDINSLRPNSVTKKIVDEFAYSSSQKQYQFKLDVDIRKYEGRPLFQAFGKVIYKAEWIIKPGPPIILLKINGAKATREAEFYVRLSCHPHIVRTYGIVENDSNGVLLVQECALNGDLSELLQEKQFRPSQSVLLEIFLQITNAMMFLADNDIVHGDLACRNVLVYRMDNSNPRLNLVKLTDFGLTRTSTLYSVINSAASTTLTVIPVRYAAPELVQHTDKPSYSQKSDIYSMGVLMWEACSQGQMPYASIETDSEVCRQKLRGEILSRPDNCQQSLWTIIVRCWQQKPDNRPTFEMLKEALLELKSQPISASDVMQLEYRQSKPILTWRDIIPADSHFTSHELAAKIRHIYALQSRSPPEIILGSDDEETIRQLCFSACEDGLIQLLRSIDAVEHLIMLICNYVTTLNDLAMEIDTIELSDRLRGRLQRRLDLRCALLKAHWLDENDEKITVNQTRQTNELLDVICNSCSSVRKFHALSYEQLKQQYLNRCTNKQCNILQNLWIGKDDSRLLVTKYHLPLSVIDWLNEQNITDVKAITSSQVNELIQFDLKEAQVRYQTADDFQTKQNISDIHDKFKANLMHLFNNEVEKRPAQYKREIEQQRVQILQALQELSSIDRTDLSNKTILRQRLTNVGTSLHVDWHFSKEEMNNANELLITINQDICSFQESINISANNEYRSDEELISYINGSAVLYGVQLIEASRKMSRPLLSQPIYAPLEEPTIASNIRQFTFTTLEDAKQFVQTIKTSGLTAAMNMRSQLVNLSSNIDSNCVTTNISTIANLSSERTTSFIKMRCMLIPIHSFHIGKEQMKLSNDAKTAINLITDLATARKFLSEFGSHITDGVQHVGGIFIQQISVETKQKTAIQTLERIVTSEWNASEQLGYRTFHSYTESVKQINVNKFSSEYEDMNQTAIVEYSELSIGPSCKNLELFRRILATSNMSWFIIDCGPVSSFIPVWELIHQLYPVDLTINEVAKLLKQAWLIEAGGCVPSESLLCEIDRVRLLPSMPVIHLQTSPVRPYSISANAQTLVYQLNNQLTEYIDSTNFSCDKMTDVELLNKVRSVTQMIVRFSHQNGHDLMALVIVKSPLKDFLNHIAHHEDYEKMQQVHVYLRTVFSEQRLRHFARHNVKLDQSFIKFIHRTAITSVKADECTSYLRQIDEYSNAPTISLLELPRYLASMVTDSDTAKGASFTNISARIALLIKKSIFGAEKNCASDFDQNNLQSIYIVLERFGWSTTREEFSSPLDEDGICALLKQLREVVNNASLSSTSTSMIDSQESMTIKQIQSLNIDQKREVLYRYSDWAIDRSLAPSGKPVKRLIDILRHRLDITLFTSVVNSNQTVASTKTFARNLLLQATSKTSSSVNTTINILPNSASNTAYDALIQLVDMSDVLSQVELFRLLLERRSPVPLLTPTRSNPPFFYYVKPLTFANVKLSTENYCNLGSNTTLFRVAVISMRSVSQSESVEFLKQVFGCNSIASSSIDCLNCLPKDSCLAELGVGFCPKVEDENDDNQSASRYNEVLVLHVIGNYTSIFPYINYFADLFIVETDSNNSIEYKPLIPVNDFQKVIIWKSATIVRDPYVSAGRYICLESTIAQALSHIHAIIDDLTNPTNKIDCNPRISIKDMKYPSLYEVDSINWITVEEDIKKQDYFKLRTCELQLQQLFVKEVEYLRSRIKTQTTYAERETADHHARECRRRREQLSPAMYNHPLIKCFIGVLSQNDEQVRTVGMCQFVKHLDFYSTEALQKLAQNQEKAHSEFDSDSQNKDKKGAYYEAKRLYASSLVSIEHLWRELCHIFVSNPKRYANLPILAAQHLLDGFSLELLDGDAGMLEQSWINAVFGALNVLLTSNDKGKNSSRIFVLSVMGVQSSGKSTLLNLMFGTRLRASAGMCTRGVNIQLLKAEDRSEYDYILILDTEGVRAPEFSGLEGSTWRDNRLATFSILPADVTIIMINNEEDTAAREVLPIVMLAYQQSELAAKSTNQLKTKLFFVYTRIDTNEKSKLSGIAQSLSLELRKAAADLEHNQRHSTNDSNNCDQNLASELLHDFLITDIQFLGKLKVRDKPPEDVPEFDYGHDIVKLNAYIYDRLTKSSPRWQARELCKFAEYMSAIWQCVQTVDFTLSFKTVLERWAYEDLQAYCRDMYGKLASLFSSAYDKLEPTILTTLNDSSLTSNDCEKIIDKFQSMFSTSVQAQEGELTGDFVSHINQQKYWQPWSVDTKHGWQLFAEKQSTDVTLRIRQLVTNRLLFDQEFTNYQKFLRSSISESFQRKNETERKAIAGDLKRQSDEFEEIFNAILHSVRKRHPVISVEKEICIVYTLSDIGKDFDFTEEYRNFQKGKMSKTVRNDPNIVKRLWKTVTSVITWSDEHRKKEEKKFLLELESYVNDLLKPVKRYIDHVPTEAIRITQKKLLEYKVKRDELRKKAHQLTYAQLVIQLSMIQSEWEKVHLIAVRLGAARNNMWEYYKKTVQGIHGISLLKSELISVFNRQLESGFLKLLQQHVTTDLTHESWIGNDQIVQAMTNLELIILIREGDIQRAVRLLSNMGEHYCTIVEDLFRKKIHSLSSDYWNSYYDLLVDAVQLAISGTLAYRNPLNRNEEIDLQLIRQGRTDFFLRTLSHGLLGKRLSDFSDDISALNVTSLSICDFEGNDVWDHVKDDVIKSIPPILPDEYLLVKNVDSLIKCIRDDLVNRFARGGVTLRCSEPCPLCGSLCRAAAGHTTDPSEDKRRHDTDHQPSGLFGTYQFETRQLVPDTCSTNIGTHYTFAYSDANDQRPYSEFSICFPTWKQPPPLTTSANEVGQYVFYHYQKELAEYHKCRPCNKIPSSFNRSLDELEQKQKNIIHGITV